MLILEIIYYIVKIEESASYCKNTISKLVKYFKFGHLVSKIPMSCTSEIPQKNFKPLVKFVPLPVQNLYICEKLSLKERVKYWTELSDYDLETAEAMLTSGRYLYVGFMCHQSIEKIFKAHHSLNSDKPSPFSHNLSFLAKKTGISKIIPSEFEELIAVLEPLNIEARYPTHKDLLLKSLTKEKCTSILLKTQELQKWVKEKL